MKLNAVARLTASTKTSVFADSHSEAGKALKALSTVLGPHFVTHQQDDVQAVIWRTAKFKAALLKDEDQDVLEFKFFDKGNTSGLTAEGYNAQTLLKDIHYNLQFKPTKPVPPDIKVLRDKLEALH